MHRERRTQLSAPKLKMIDGDFKRQPIFARIAEIKPELSLVSSESLSAPKPDIDLDSVITIPARDIDYVHSALKRLALEAKTEANRLGSDGGEFSHIARQIEALASRTAKIVYSAGDE